MKTKQKSILAALTAKFCEERLARQYLDGEKFNATVEFLLQIFRQALKDGGVEESRARDILLRVQELLDRQQLFPVDPR